MSLQNPTVKSHECSQVANYSAMPHLQSILTLAAHFDSLGLALVHEGMRSWRALLNGGNRMV